MPRKAFIKHNTSFTCLNCGEKNPPAKISERNHCRACLFSLHVDDETPGDRLSSCCGMMKPAGLEHKGKKGFMIKHRCEKCGKIMLNKRAEDDENVTLSEAKGPL